jgi:hypothetical protein
MLPGVSLADPAWQRTFPFRVAPRPGEWLAGLLLRCDEVNHWGSGTTLAHLRRANHKSVTNDLRLVLPSGLNLDDLAQALAVPRPAVVATTYQAELARLYDVTDPPATLLASSFTPHLCPACVAENRRLARFLTLPHLTHCPEHRVTLVRTCHCGAALRLFHRQAAPFTCFRCHRDWGELPCLRPDPERLALEQKLLAYYEFFWAQGTPALLAAALRLIYDSVVETGELRVPLLDDGTAPPFEGRSYQQTTTLGYVVQALLQLNLSPREILIYAGPLPWRSVKWITFQCPASNCPYVKMLREQARLLDPAQNHVPAGE